MCLIYKHLHAMCMCHLYNRTKIRTNSIVCRIIDKDSYCLWMFKNRLFYLAYLHTKRDSQTIIHLRIYIYWNCTAKHKCIYYTLMNISRQNDFISCLADRKHHTLNRGRCSSNHKKCMIGTKCLCR